MFSDKLIHDYFLIVQYLLRIEQDDTLSRDSLQVFRSNPGNRDRRCLNSVKRNGLGPENSIGQDTEFHAAVMEDNHLVELAEPFVRQIEKLFEINHRKDLPVYVDDAEHKGRHKIGRASCRERV